MLVRDQISQAKPSQSTELNLIKQGLSSDMTIGHVISLIYNNLYNTLEIETCPGTIGGPTFEIIDGWLAYRTLYDSFDLGNGGTIDEITEVYLAAVLDKPDIAMAVLITIPIIEETYIYIPNNGNFGINLIIDDNDESSAGLLIKINTGPISATTTKVSCRTCDGSYGTGCKCTCRTITITCVDGEPCIYPGGGQCAGSCNRGSDWSLVCSDLNVFYDPTSFYRSLPGTMIP